MSLVKSTFENRAKHANEPESWVNPASKSNFRAQFPFFCEINRLKTFEEWFAVWLRILCRAALIGDDFTVVG